MSEPVTDPMSFVGYLNMAEKIEKNVRTKTISLKKSIKIAYLSSFNPKGLRRSWRSNAFNEGYLRTFTSAGTINTLKNC